MKPSPLAALFLILSTLLALTAVHAESGNKPLSGELDIVSSVGDDPRRPDVAMAENGEFVAVYHLLDPGVGEVGVFAQFYDAAGDAQGEPILLNETFPAHSPAIAMDEDGNFAVIWKSNALIRGRGFNASGAPIGDEFRLKTGGCSGGHPNDNVCVAFASLQIAYGGNGHYLAAWERNELSNHFQNFLIEGRSLTLEAPGPARGFTDLHQGFMPVLAPGAEGTFHVAWYSFTGGLRRLVVDDRGKALGPSTFILEDRSPAIAADNEGGFLFAWQHEDLSGNDGIILANRYDSEGVAQGDAFTVNNTPAEPGRAPQIAVDTDGNFVILWQSLATAEEKNKLYARKFNRDGEPVGDEFTIAEDFSYHQVLPKIAMNPKGDFVVVWENFLDGRYETKARVFSAYFCREDATTLCLGDGRFQVRSEWRDFQGETGTGKAELVSNDTGYFWFFSDNNIELMLKVLDARHINGRFWVFYGALSNVEYDILVTDTANGNSQPYFNPLYEFASVGDTQGLPGKNALPFEAKALAPASGEAFVQSRQKEAGESCIDGAEVLCLQQSRFEVTVDWKDFDGNTGSGQSGDLVDDTGYFWFFNQENVEVVVKVLDGRHINGHFWVFYGALSDVEYTIRVKDTETGLEQEYFNPMRQFASYGDDEAFPAEMPALEP